MKTSLEGSKEETKRKLMAAFPQKWALPIRRVLPVFTKARVGLVFSDSNRKEFRDKKAAYPWSRLCQLGRT